MNRSTWRLILATAVVLFLPSLALADSNNDAGGFQFSADVPGSAIIDFGIVAPALGSITYNGGKKGGAANPLLGKDISVNFVEGEFSPKHNFVKLDLVDGLLSFETGNFFSSSSTAWFFAGGGELTITAKCIDFKGNTDTCEPGDLVPDLDGVSGLVMTGLWSSAELSETNPKEKTLKVEAGLIEDVVWQPLLGFYGLKNPPVGNLNGDINLSLTGSGNPNKTFTSTRILSGDLADVNVPISPEPSTLLLFGTGMFGAASVLRRRFKSK